MLDDQRTPTTSSGIASSSSINSRGEVPDDDATEIRDIHALTSPSTSRAAARRRESWEAGSHRSSSLSVASDIENFSTMSREFSALVVAGSTMQDTPTDSIVSSSTDLITSTPNNNNSSNSHNNLNLARIGEEELLEETNPLAIVPDSNPIPSPRRPNHNINNNNNNRSNNSASGNSMMIGGPSSSSCEDEVVSVHMVKKEEVESKIAAWQTAEIAKINNRFKREDVVINGWESEQVEKATSCLKKVERKLDEQRARAVEKMQNDVAKARRKAEEKRASAEAKRGTKVARILEMSNLLRAVGRAPSKRSFF